MNREVTGMAIVTEEVSQKLEIIEAMAQKVYDQALEICGDSDDMKEAYKNIKSFCFWVGQAATHA